MAKTPWCCSRRDLRIVTSGFTSRSVMAGCSRKRPSTGCTRPSLSRALTDETCFSRAARCWADQARSTVCFMSAVSTRITTAGASTAIWAGASTTCCLISRRPRTRRAAATIFTGSAVPCRFRTGGPPTRFRAGSLQTTTKSGRRASTAVAYLRPAKARPNLHVETSALAERILFEGRRAVGVAYRAVGIPRTARARKEILISGGAFNSPQLLQLSGVGPADLLRQHGIEVVLDAPGVGNDLQDHMQVRVVMRCSQAITLNDIVNNPIRKVLTGLRYAMFRTGPLTIAAGTSGAFFKTNPRLATPDIQIHFLPFSTAKMGEKLHPFSGFTASVCQLRPESRGSLRIKSADPAEPPEIRINYLASDVDRATNVEGLKILRRILHAPALAPYVVEEVDPGDKITSDEALLAYCRARGTTIYHPTSTCRMGNDPLAVVDQRLRVRGLDGLRVIDASVMPDLVSGNTNAPVIMIAEKASDMILHDAG